MRGFEYKIYFVKNNSETLLPFKLYSQFNQTFHSVFFTKNLVSLFMIDNLEFCNVNKNEF